MTTLTITQTYATPGLYVWSQPGLPEGAQGLSAISTVTVVGGGGGAGNGNVDPNQGTGGAVSSGSGGGGAAFAQATYVLSALPPLVPITVGFGGPGGAQVSSSSSNLSGNSGASGTFSAFGDGSTTGLLAGPGTGGQTQGSQGGGGAATNFGTWSPTNVTTATGGQGGVFGSGSLARAGGNGNLAAPAGAGGAGGGGSILSGGVTTLYAGGNGNGTVGGIGPKNSPTPSPGGGGLSGAGGGGAIGDSTYNGALSGGQGGDATPGSGGGGGGSAGALGFNPGVCTSPRGGNGAVGVVIVTTVYVVLLNIPTAGGQHLTPNPNVTAVAGMGGDKWGANGGDINPIGGGVTGVQGWDERIKVTQSDGQRTTTYEVNPIPVNSVGAPTQSVLSQVSTGALSELSYDDALPGGGSHAG